MPVILERGRSRLEVNIKVKSLFDKSIPAQNVQVTVPMPKNYSKAKIEVGGNGTLLYHFCFWNYFEFFILLIKL